MYSDIRTRGAIVARDIVDLLDGGIAAVRIPDYYSPDVCSKLSLGLSASALSGAYANAPSIRRVGQAFFECQASEELERNYQDNSVNWMADIRQLCSPILTPSDRVRLEFDEVWPAGAQLHAFGSAKAFAGLSREFGEGSGADPHQDILPWDAPGVPEAVAVTRQLAMNVYLSLAEEGGELCLWNRELSQPEYDAYRIPGGYGVREELIGAPDHVITPELGELILFNARNVHAVRKITKGTRRTWSAFIGQTTPEAPLRVWS